jgi:hypothetical protein
LTQNNASTPVGILQDHRHRDVVQQLVHLLSQGRRTPSVQQAPEIVAIPNKPLPAISPTDHMNSHTLMPRHELQYPTSGFLPIDNVNLRDWLSHREIQYVPWSITLPSLPSPFISSSLLPTLPSGPLIETQPDIQQLLQSIHDSNLLRQYHGHLSANLHTAVRQENLASRIAMLSRTVHESPIAAYLLSRSIVREPGGSQRVVVPDPPALRHPPAQIILPQKLVQPEDPFTLSKFQVLLRENIEVFQATHEEERLHVRGRNVEIYLNQVGIRCIHCKHLPMVRRKKGFMYFPSNTLRIYQAAQNMATWHMLSGLCEEMPGEVQEQFQTLGTTKAVAGKAGRVYWAQSAEDHLGLVNTPLGIRRTIVGNLIEI